MALLVILLILQLTAFTFTAAATALDGLEGVFTALVHLIEASATALLIFSSTLAMDFQQTKDRETLVRSLALAELSGNILMGAVYAPLVQTVYDAVFLPIYVKVKHTEGTCLEVFHALLLGHMSRRHTTDLVLVLYRH